MLTDLRLEPVFGKSSLFCAVSKSAPSNFMCPDGCAAQKLQHLSIGNSKMGVLTLSNFSS